jgi:hypothetical protein
MKWDKSKDELIRCVGEDGFYTIYASELTDEEREELGVR